MGPDGVFLQCPPFFFFFFCSSFFSTKVNTGRVLETLPPSERPRLFAAQSSVGLVLVRPMRSCCPSSSSLAGDPGRPLECLIDAYWTTTARVSHFRLTEPPRPFPSFWTECSRRCWLVLCCHYWPVRPFMAHIQLAHNSEKHPVDSNWNQLLKQVHLKSSEKQIFSIYLFYFFINKRCPNA